jgi:hypothetical protein
MKCKTKNKIRRRRSPESYIRPTVCVENASTYFVQQLRKIIKNIWPSIWEQTPFEIKTYLHHTYVPNLPPTRSRCLFFLKFRNSQPELNQKIDEWYWNVQNIINRHIKTPMKWCHLDVQRRTRNSSTNYSLKLVVVPHELHEFASGWYETPPPTIDGKNTGLKLALNTHTIQRLRHRYCAMQSRSPYWLKHLHLLTTPNKDRYRIVGFDMLTPTPLDPYYYALKNFVVRSVLGSLIIPPNIKNQGRLICKTYLLPGSRTKMEKFNNKIKSDNTWDELTEILGPLITTEFDEHFIVLDKDNRLYTTRTTPTTIDLEPTNTIVPSLPIKEKLSILVTSEERKRIEILEKQFYKYKWFS